MIPYGTRVLGKQVDSLRAGELDESTKTPLLLVKTSSNKPKTMMENKKNSHLLLSVLIIIHGIPAMRSTGYIKYEISTRPGGLMPHFEATSTHAPTTHALGLYNHRIS